MKRHAMPLLLGSTLLSAAALAEPGGFFDMGADDQPTQVLVDFTEVDAQGLSELAKSMGVNLRFNSEFSDADENFAVVEADSPGMVQRLISLFQGRADVESVEPNYVYHGLFTPDDPMLKHQWHMDMIHMADAWAKARGRGVVVAVIDTGVSDGKGKLKPVEDLDPDRFVPGYNFVSDSPDASDDHAHGTHVAGTVAQSTDNGKGVAGVAFEARIMPIKVLSARGGGTVSDIAEGIRWAVRHGADVINMSLGGPFPSLALARAVAYARSHGVVVVCAAGNSGRKGVGYPAAHSGSIAVSALGPDKTLSFYSSWGKQVAIAAPGGDTRVDLNNDGIPDGVLQNTIVPGDPSRQGYFPFQGTSMASPHVAGVAALIIGQGITSPDKVQDILEGSAESLGDGEKYGAGMVDAAAAVSRAIWRPGLLRALLMVILAWLLARIIRTSDRMSSSVVTPGFVLALVVGACGLFFLRGFETTLWPLFVVTRPALEWPAALLGWNWHLNAVVGSALPAFVVGLLLYGIKPLRPLAAGFAVGVSAYLLACAVDGSVNVRWVPGAGGLFDRAWLAGNALLTFGMARMMVPRR
ncbi:MAG: S8 family serine peptidase [Pseudomonadota bacterium]